ncbi:hydroxymethylglutaryl-CoA lyase [Herbaspirillum sp. alder98]|uniref:hydroxymethylglutaryl-CoA lyase n=1 Tax=Herbaspirillum sp. alder98 TaxID=2913096 RepID=UPI001CD8A3D3|nr:hydroxymethylglutaryl-CoA lyase [Herbaspirillum sp. alder98]MCA1322858.1 hydroxymethylglutaryl-CoA lyase [Herbaspirillum sp. alder98]
MSSTPAVQLVEVGPRDGLQNEKRMLTPEVRLELIGKLVAAGLTAIEVGSFVSPKWVPQMAGSDQVVRQASGIDGLRASALVPNLKGMEAALAAGCKEIAVFAAASETFSQKNINCSIADSIERFRPVMALAQANGVAVRGYVSCVMGCPYEGPIAPPAVAGVTAQLLALGCYEISLGDTIGAGTPHNTRELVRACAEVAPLSALAGHFHDTWGMAVANVQAAFDAGIRTFDASVSGLGGCPYSPGATGNVATEDLVYLFDGQGVRTGVDLDALIAAGAFIDAWLERPSASRVARARKATLAAAHS